MLRWSQIGKKRARLELRDERPGQRWNKGFQAIIPGIGPVIDDRRGVWAIERAHFDRITRFAPCEVVADILLAADRCRWDGRGNRAAIVLGVRNRAPFPARLARI